MLAPEQRLAFRATNADLHNLAVIADGLRAAGRTFTNRTDALRHALQTVAFAMSAPADGTPASLPR